MRVLKCDMLSCRKDATHIDQEGFVYCEPHGIARRAWKSCRKIRPHELKKLQAGKTLERY